jgi:hypothetical protein
VPKSRNPDGHHGRGVPDVAGNASPLSGYILWLYDSLGTEPQAGTSAVAPLYAALIALINASLDARVGYLNPTLYALGGTGVFHDINDGISNSFYFFNGTSPGYTSGPGWDAVTGWGTINGGAFLTTLKPIYMRATTLILDRSTFGKHEVTAAMSGGVATFTDAVYVVADGFIPQQLGLKSGNLNNPPITQIVSFGDTFTSLAAQGVTLVFDKTTGVQLENLQDFRGPQRITFPFNVVFSSLNAFSAIPTSPGYLEYALSATVATIAGGGTPAESAQSAVAVLELTLQADPYMHKGETWWLNDDMRVFTVTPATLATPTTPPLQDSTTQWTGDPNTYITQLLTELNKSFTDPTSPNTPFTGISPLEESSLQLNTDVSGNPIYNFGLARVRLQGGTAMNVRTFFRLFISPSPDTDYDPTTTFRSAVETDIHGNPISGTLIPLIGFPSSDMTATLPFFASPRIDATTYPTTYQTDTANVQQIPRSLAPTPPTGAVVCSYFGCYLDINQRTPQFPRNPSTASTSSGPWSLSELQPISGIIVSNHACLVAQIAYDPDPIPSGANAANSDKLGQRNLNWAGSGNPGDPATHRVPALFDIRPSAIAAPSRLDPPDELMIEWGDTPVGSKAAIYLPQVSANGVIALADKLYVTHSLRAEGANTIVCATGAITYVPIPPGSGQNFAGLLTLDLPSTVRKGQQFEVVVRRVTSAQIRSDANATARHPPLNWRYVVGAFQINIPVSTEARLLASEENLLAVFKWKLEQLPVTNRWVPVLHRYIDQVAGRVDGFGGNASSIPPSLSGYPLKGTKG